MDDLRRDLIEAFDKGQTELGDLQGVRERMLRGAYASRRTRPDNRLQLAAGVAVILIAALVIGTFVYVRAVIQLSPAGRINVPDSTPLILYHDPANADQIDGVTWDGRTSGRIGLGGLSESTSNAAGTLFATSTGEVRDRAGRLVQSKGFSGLWADDERSYCFMFPKGFVDVGAPAILGVSKPGETVSSIAQIGTYPAVTENRPPPSIAACSVENDRAVVFQGSGVAPSLTFQDWVVQLSTGRILWTHTIKLPGSSSIAVGIAASHDGQFVAESVAAPAPSKATIFGPDGSAMAHFEGTVEAFSWDGSLAVTSPGSGSPVTLMRWREGTVVWTSPTGLYFFRAARSEPGGTRVAIGLIPISSADPTTVRLVHLYVVSADGRLVWSKNNVNLA